MALHESTFGFLAPTDDQKQTMNVVRAASKSYADILDKMLPDGPDKTYALRKVREIAMWANVAVTRSADGTPRDPDTVA